MLADNDDAAERKANRQRKRTMTSGRVRSSPASKQLANKALNSQQLVSLYQGCINLSAENKIDKKNTWSLNLLDYMDDFLTSDAIKGQDADDTTHFQTGSSILDAGIKIYSSRVDAVHAEAFKVLGNLTRGDAGGNDGDDDEDDAAPKMDAGMPVPPKPKVKRGPRKIKAGVATLATKADDLDCKELEYQIQTDPLFRKTSAAFDEGGAKGLLLNNLGVHAGEGSGCRLVFDSSDACTAKEGKPDPATAKGVTASGEFWSGIVSQLKAVVEVSAKSELSPDFTNYRLARQGDPSASTLDVEINDDVFASEGFTNDGGAGADFEGGDFGADAGFDDDDDNDDDNDCGGDFGGGYDDVMVPEAGPSVGDMAVAAAGSASDYSFFDASTMSSAPGAGAGHWKAQRAKKTKAEKEEEAAEKKQDKGSKFLIDFENLDDKAIAKAMAPSKTSTTLSAANIEGATEESTTLPDDLHYQFNTLLSLFTKPELVMRRAGSAGDDDTPSAAGGWYDYDNANDKDFVGGGDCGGADDDDDDGGFDAYHAFDDGLEGTELGAAGAGGLVDAPQRAEEVRLTFARKAKKVDVHALKESLWEQLEPEDEGAAAPLKKKDENSMAQWEACALPIEDTTFKDLIAKTEPTLGGEQRANVTTAFHFICLLHLANEKDLKIENPAYGDFTNLLITQRDPDEIVLESHDSPDEAKAKAATKRPAATAKKMAAPKSKGKGKGKKATKAAVEEDENAPVDVMA